MVIFSGEKKIHGAATKTFDRFCKLKIDKISTDNGGDIKRKCGEMKQDKIETKDVSRSDCEGLMKLWRLDAFIDKLTIDEG